jgi:UDP-2,3-diacylglucosamine pyrophosphatase LpxH
MSNHTIIISDLHIDDWTDRKIRGKTRKELFFEFLDWCDAQDTRELIINGDLMDMPPYKGQYVFQNLILCPDGSQTCIAREVVERLLQFGAKRNVTYVFGNHDIGISGFRCEGPNDVAGLQGANFSYPNYVIPQIGDSAILIEHGHFYDPFLALYLRDLAKRTYQPWELDKFDWTMQRRNPTTGERRRKTTGIPGESVKPIRMKVDDHAYETVKAEQRGDAELSLAGVLDWSKKFAEDMGKAIVDIPKRAIWWAAALHKMREYISEQNCSGKRLYQVFGHTHRAFVGEESKGVGVEQNGVQCFYINSGGWTDDTSEGWYLDVNEDGIVYLQDWIKEKEEYRVQR